MPASGALVTQAAALGAAVMCSSTPLGRLAAPRTWPAFLLSCGWRRPHTSTREARRQALRVMRAIPTGLLQRLKPTFPRPSPPPASAIVRSSGMRRPRTSVCRSDPTAAQVVDLRWRTKSRVLLAQTAGRAHSMSTCASMPRQRRRGRSTSSCTFSTSRAGARARLSSSPTWRARKRSRKQCS